MRLFELTYKNYKEELAIKGHVEHCRKYYRNYFERYKTPVIWRGTYSNLGAITKINPKAVGRTSAHTSNEYTVLMSNLPEWNAFPKRSESLICSFSQDFASDYGQTYGVVLPNKFRLGVAPNFDIWESFPVLNKTFGFEYGMSHFNDSISEITNIRANAKTTVEDIQNTLAKVQSIVIKALKSDPDMIQRLRHNPLAKYIIANISSDAAPTALFDVIRKCMDPKANGFKVLTNIDELPMVKSRKSSEVWTDSQLLLIDLNTYEDLRDRVLGSGS
jgi:hypothetical protein